MPSREAYVYFNLIPIALSVWLRKFKFHLSKEDFEDTVSELYMLYKQEPAFAPYRDEDKDSDCNYAMVYSMIFTRIPKTINKLHPETFCLEEEYLSTKQGTKESYLENFDIILNDDDAKIATWYFIENQSVPDIAQMLGISVSSVYGAIEKIARRLRRVYEA